MPRALRLTLVCAALATLVTCVDQNGENPAAPTNDDTLLGKRPPASCLSTEQEALSDGIRTDIEALFSDQTGVNPATQQLNNIERKLCKAQYEDALGMAWAFLGLIEDKMPDGFLGDAADAAALASEMFALVGADPNPAGPAVEIPPGAFDETGGITTFDPSAATPEDPIIAGTGNGEAAVVVDAPDVFPPGTGPVTIVLARQPEGLVTSPGAFIPGFQAYEEGYEILSSAQPWDQGPGALVALCVVPPIPEGVDLVIGHVHEEEVSLLVPTTPDPQTLGYIDCSDVEPYPGDGGIDVIGQATGAGWTRWLRRALEPVGQWLTPAPLDAAALGIAGPGLGGRTRSFSFDAPVDPTIEVGETIQLSVGTDAAWSSSNGSVATVDSDGLVTGVGPGTATITADFTDYAGQPASLSMDITVEGEEGLIAFVSDRDGDLEIYAMSPDGSGQTNLTNSGGQDILPQWSPDGSRIAFVSDRSEVSRIYTMDPDGGNLEGPFGVSGGFYSLTWSPDGSEIAYVVDQSGTREMHVMQADGTGDVVLPIGEGAFYIDWSPDGAQFAANFPLQDVIGEELVVFNADGTGTPTQVTLATVLGFPRWSPDGTRILFSGSPTNTNGWDIYVIDADGSNSTLLANPPGPDQHAVWSPDGSRIVYAGLTASLTAAIYVMNADGTGQTPITGSAPGNNFDPDWQPVPEIVVP